MSGKPRVHRRRTSNRHLLPPTRRSLEFPLPGKPPCPIVTSITRPQAWESGGMSHKRYEARLLSSLRRSTSHSEFMPVIDGLRFLAILPVVLQHLCERAIRIAEDRHLATASDYALINLFPTGYLGVELFFVIERIHHFLPLRQDKSWKGEWKCNLKPFEAIQRVRPLRQDKSWKGEWKCNLKPFEAIQRVRPPPGRGAARRPEASLAWETATSLVKRRQRMLKPCVSLEIMYPLRPSVWVGRGRCRQDR